VSGFEIGPWSPVGDEGWKTHNGYRASIKKTVRETGKVGSQA